MILSTFGITKTFGTDVILQDISINVDEHDKIAIVGANGTGKTTLLKIIVGETLPDSGNVIIGNNKKVGYLSQIKDISSDMTIYDVMLEACQEIIALETKIRELETVMNTTTGEELAKLLNTYTRLTHEFELKNGYAYKSELVGVLKGLGFEEKEFGRALYTLSGGQRTRVELAKLLVLKPDILILDEPTNHLDMNSVVWLENFLTNYNGAVLLVAHDRYFLDKIVTKVIELECGKSTTFMGDYSDYSHKKAALRDNELKAYINQQKEIKHQEEVIAKLKSYNREKSVKRAESREKLLAKINVLDKPMEQNYSMNITLKPNVLSGNDVLSVENLTKIFDDGKVLFQDIHFQIKRGEKIAIIGNNGTGKTTILKILNRIIKQTSGKFTLGSNVYVGYYDQEHQVLDMKKSVLNELSDTYPTLTGTQIRNILAAFLFTNDDVFKLVGSLSGGERGRVSLAKLMLSKANLLILDEPTNHLDIFSKEILESALNNYTGTVLYVSHDRYFINQTATRILELTPSSVTNYLGNYDYYLEKKKEHDNTVVSSNELQLKEQASTQKISYQDQKQEQARERKRLNDLKKIETQIAEVEIQIAEIDQLLTQEEIYTNTSKLLPLNDKRNELDNLLEDLMVTWDELSV